MRRAKRFQRIVGALALMAFSGGNVAMAQAGPRPAANTPIKHLVVIFQENVSFDHYFGTYPRADNPAGEPAFFARRGTPTINGLNMALRTENPNALNGSGGVNPFRFDRSQAATCDQDHDYTDEQGAFHAGLMDQFLSLGGTGTSGNLICHPTDVMGYFDGNTVTALWNYAQHYAMSDNSFGTTFGPSTPGALNLISGNTNGATPSDSPGDTVAGSVVGDPQPAGDDCDSRETVSMSGTNVGDRLNASSITWGWFQGGFRPTSRDPVTGKAVCGATHIGANGLPKGDYIPHHEPFQYYASTANPHHLRPSSPAMIGSTDRANHQYDIADFWTAAFNGELPAVSFLKAPGYRDGHAGYSSPLAEQTFVADTINKLQSLEQWEETAVVISWDDSDGWYDHVMGPIVSQSNTSADALTGAGACGAAFAGTPQGRCGYGPRLPLLVVSPFAKTNFVDHSTTDQSSILRFIEHNWNLPSTGPDSFDRKAGTLLKMFDFTPGHNAGRLFLDPSTGEPL